MKYYQLAIITALLLILGLTGCTSAEADSLGWVNMNVRGQLDANNNTIINVPLPINDTDAANKEYVDDRTNYAGMYRYNSVAVTAIQQVNDWHLVNGFTTGYLGGGWTFHAGERLAITAFMNNGDGRTQLTIVVHILSNTDVISISNTTSYDGVWIVQQVAVNTFVIDTPWVANEGAKIGEHGSHYHSADEFSAGKYLVTYSLSLAPLAPNCSIEASVYYNATNETHSSSRTKLGAIGDYQNIAGFSIVNVSVNGIISLGIRNITDGGDFVIVDGNMTAVKLGN